MPALRVRGVGVVAATGVGVDAALASLAGPPPARPPGAPAGAPEDGARFPAPFDPVRDLPRGLGRRLGRQPAMALAAILEALGGAPVDPAAALVLGTAHGAMCETIEFLAGAARSGERYASPAMFAASLHNVMTGAASRELGVRGPAVAVSAGTASFEAALLAASALLASGAAPLAVVGAADAFHPMVGRALRLLGLAASPDVPEDPAEARAARGLHAGEGAAALVVEAPAAGAAGGGDAARRGGVTVRHVAEAALPSAAAAAAGVHLACGGAADEIRRHRRALGAAAEGARIVLPAARNGAFGSLSAVAVALEAGRRLRGGSDPGPVLVVSAPRGLPPCGVLVAGGGVA